MNVLCPDKKKSDATLAMLERRLKEHYHFINSTVVYGFKLCAPFFIKCKHYAVCYDTEKMEINFLCLDNNLQPDIVCLNRQTIVCVRRTICGGWRIRIKDIKKPLKILVPCHTCRESKFSGVLYANQVKRAAGFRFLMESFI